MDGKTAEVDVNVNALTLFKLQNEGVIDRDFLSGLMNVKAQSPDIKSMLTAVYVAYRQANKDHMKFEDFLKNYSLDAETDVQIYLALVSRKARDKFQQGFLKRAAIKAAK